MFQRKRLPVCHGHTHIHYFHTSVSVKTSTFTLWVPIPIFLNLSFLTYVFQWLFQPTLCVCSCNYTFPIIYIYLHTIQEYCQPLHYSSVCVPVGLLGSDEEDLELGVVVYLLLNLFHKQRGLDCSLNSEYSFVVVNPPVQSCLLQAHVQCMQFMNNLSH